MTCPHLKKIPLSEEKKEYRRQRGLSEEGSLEVCELGTEEEDGSPYVPTFEEHVRRCSGRHLESCPFYREYHQEEQEHTEEYRPEDPVPAVWNCFRYKCRDCGKTFLEDSKEDQEHTSFERRESYVYLEYLTLEGTEEEYEIIERVKMECKNCGGEITYRDSHNNYCCENCHQAHYIDFDNQKLAKWTGPHIDRNLNPKMWW